MEYYSNTIIGTFLLCFCLIALRLNLFWSYNVLSHVQTIVLGGTVKSKGGIVIQDSVVHNNGTHGDKQRAALAYNVNLLVVSDAHNGPEKTTITKAYTKKSLSSAEKVAGIQADFYLPPSPDDIPLAPNQRLVAIGDIHGNLTLLLTMLIESKIIDRPIDDAWIDNHQLLLPMIHWIAADTILVQVGDILDRGYQEETCIKILCKLGRQARQHGGRVICLWGNHEALAAHSFAKSGRSLMPNNRMIACNWMSGWNSREGMHQPTRAFMFRPGGLLARPFLSNLKVAVKVGRTVLVHGGLTCKDLHQCGGSIESMNKAACDWILWAGDRVSDHQPQCLKSGPQYMRDYSRYQELSKESQLKVNSVLQKLDADRIVVGHSVQSIGVNAVHDNKVWRVDVGDGRVNYKGSLRIQNPRINIALEVFGTGQTSIVTRQGPWQEIANFCL